MQKQSWPRHWKEEVIQTKRKHYFLSQWRLEITVDAMKGDGGERKPSGEETPSEEQKFFHGRENL